MTFPLANEEHAFLAGATFTQLGDDVTPVLDADGNHTAEAVVTIDEGYDMREPRRQTTSRIVVLPPGVGDEPSTVDGGR